MVVRKSKRGDFEIEELDDIELPTDLDDKISKITLDAEADIDSTRVNFRWQKAPLNLIKSVAKEMGIDLGLMMVVGIIFGVITSFAGYLYALWANHKWDLPMRDTPDISIEKPSPAEARNSRR